jgi:hypothetical protein
MESQGFQDFAKIATEFARVRHRPVARPAGGDKERFISRELAR